MLVFYASSASSIPKAQSRAESVFLQLKSIHPSKGHGNESRKVARERRDVRSGVFRSRLLRGNKRNLGRQKPVPPRTYAKSGPKPQDVLWTRRRLRVRWCLSPKAQSLIKGARRECLFAFFFVTIFLFGAFFLHLILIILIDPDFNNEQQQQKTLTEEKTL